MLVTSVLSSSGPCNCFSSNVCSEMSTGCISAALNLKVNDLLISCYVDLLLASVEFIHSLAGLSACFLPFRSSGITVATAGI